MRKVWAELFTRPNPAPTPSWQMSPTPLDANIGSGLVRRNPKASQKAEAYSQTWGPLNRSVITHDEALSGLLYRDARLQLSRIEAIGALSEIVPVTAESAMLPARFAATRSRYRGHRCADCGRCPTQWPGTGNQQPKTLRTHRRRAAGELDATKKGTHAKRVPFFVAFPTPYAGFPAAAGVPPCSLRTCWRILRSV